MEGPGFIVFKTGLNGVSQNINAIFGFISNNLEDRAKADPRWKLQRSVPSGVNGPKFTGRIGNQRVDIFFTDIFEFEALLSGEEIDRDRTVFVLPEEDCWSDAGGKRTVRGLFTLSCEKARRLVGDECAYPLLISGSRKFTVEDARLFWLNMLAKIFGVNRKNRREARKNQQNRSSVQERGARGRRKNATEYFVRPW